MTTDNDKYGRDSKGNVIIGKWTKLSTTGEFGAAVRGGYGERLVGKLIQIKSKAGNFDVVRIAAVAKDWGPGDVCEYAIERL